MSVFHSLLLLSECTSQEDCNYFISQFAGAAVRRQLALFARFISFQFTRLVFFDSVESFLLDVARENFAFYTLLLWYLSDLSRSTESASFLMQKVCCNSVECFDSGILLIACGFGAIATDRLESSLSLVSRPRWQHFDGWAIDERLLRAGEAFCGVKDLRDRRYAQFLRATNFLSSLLRIGRLLGEVTTGREDRQLLLAEEILQLNVNLPCVAIAPEGGGTIVQVLRLIPSECVILNSAKKCPFLVTAEVLVGREEALVLPHRSAKIFSAQLKSVPAGDQALEMKRRLLREFNALPVQSSEDPSAAILGESWEEKEDRIRTKSEFQEMPGWKIASLIVKCESDLRQEEIALSLLAEVFSVLQDAAVDCWFGVFSVISLEKGGVVEVVHDAVSLHAIHKEFPTLLAFFKAKFGENFTTAKTRFLISFASYSLFCWVFGLRDRHNGNILIDSRGHILHIDFEFFLQNRPGSSLFSIEASPFKMTPEFVEVLGEDGYEKSKELFLQGFIALRNKHRHFCWMIEKLSMMCPNVLCFSGGATAAIEAVKERLLLNLDAPDENLTPHIDRLFSSSCGNYSTRIYDSFQYFMNGIL